jgi:hypothetical protein
VEKIRNHRPDMIRDALPPRWLDGSGRFTDWFHADGSQNGTDARGCYGLVSLDHYALRSLGSFFMKTLRGDVVVANKQVSLRYWKVRNRNEVATSTYAAAVETAAQDYHARVFERDPALMALHEAACRWHSAKIMEVADLPEFAKRQDWILAHAWGARALAEEGDPDSDADEAA